MNLNTSMLPTLVTALSGLVSWIVAMCVAFNVNLTQTQQGLIVGGVAVIASVITAAVAIVNHSQVQAAGHIEAARLTAGMGRPSV